MPILEMRRDNIDATCDGTLGWRADTSRQFVPGLPRYFSDGVEVTATEFAKLAQEQLERFDAAA